MKVEEVDIEIVKPYENNARYNEDGVDVVANSIAEFGFKQPIVVDENNVIIVGHTRLKAAKKLGLATVPVVVANDLSEEKVKAYRLADNKTAEFSDWDFDKLEVELDELADIDDLDMEDFGFLPFETEEEENEVHEANLDETAPSRTSRGQIWKLGRHRLMIGDSTSENDINLLTEKHNIDFIYTDPPYGMNAVSKSGVLSEKYSGDILNDDSNEVAIASFLLSQEKYPDTKQLWWGANYYSSALPDSECWIVWDKNNGKSDQADAELAWTNFRSVARIAKMASEKTNRIHPTQKPAALFQEIERRMFKKQKPEYVLDLFAGSGSTMIACEQLGLTNYSMELDEKFADAIIARWERLTGGEAEIVQ